MKCSANNTHETKIVNTATTSAFWSLQCLLEGLPKFSESVTSASSGESG